MAMIHSHERIGRDLDLVCVLNVEEIHGLAYLSGALLHEVGHDEESHLDYEEVEVA